MGSGSPSRVGQLGLHGRERLIVRRTSLLNQPPAFLVDRAQLVSAEYPEQLLVGPEKVNLVTFFEARATSGWVLKHSIGASAPDRDDACTSREILHREALKAAVRSNREPTY